MTDKPRQRTKGEIKKMAYAWASSVIHDARDAADVPDEIGSGARDVELWYDCLAEITDSLYWRSRMMGKKRR